MNRRIKRRDLVRRLWFNGAVVSMDPAMTRYEAVGVEGGRIVFLGSSRDALSQAWDERRDLEGASVLPGFTDSHMHLLHYAWLRRNLSLFGVGSIEELIRRCREQIRQDSPAYLIAQGWNHDTMEEGRLVTRRDLDRVSTSIPVCALRACLHIGACNTVMLERIRSLPHVDPDVLAKVDFENGILREEALHLYSDVLPAANDQAVRSLILLAQRELNAAGVTCVNSDDLRTIPGVDPFRLIQVFREMERRGELTLRIVEQCQIYREDFDRFQAVRSDPGDRDSLFRTGPRKLLQDGSLGARSAEMEGGYADAPDNFGIPIYTEEELFQYIDAAHRAHMDVAVHTIGDLALRKACDAFERAEKAHAWPGHRHGVVHAQITTPALLRRIKELGLQVFIQPIFIDADMKIIAQRVGERRARECYNWKTMIDLGLHVSGGSDCPVEPFDVLDNLRAAITRKDRSGSQTYLPEQALTVEQALRLFTTYAAWSSRDEAVRGALIPGMQADLVVLDRDLFAISPDAISQTAVLETVLAGKTVYRA